jgi:hypothetical protein
MTCNSIVPRMAGSCRMVPEARNVAVAMGVPFAALWKAVSYGPSGFTGKLRHVNRG